MIGEQGEFEHRDCSDTPGTVLHLPFCSETQFSHSRTRSYCLTSVHPVRNSNTCIRIEFLIGTQEIDIVK